jgi:predicted HicB family RNase H-like nuclease
VFKSVPARVTIAPSSDTIAINLRLPRSLHTELVAIAREERRSLNAQLVRFLELAAELANAGAPGFESPE